MNIPHPGAIVRHIITGESLRVHFVAEDLTVYGERVHPDSEHDGVSTTLDRVMQA